MDKQIRKNKIITIVIFIIVSLIAILIFNWRNSSEEDAVVSDEKINLLSDYNRFFTINSCVYKYVTYLQNEDVDSLLKVLSDDYVVSNNINSSNIYDYLGKLNGNYSFVSKKIYFENIDENYIKYYVYGYLSEDVLDGNANKEDKYFEVYLDIENQLFSINPYDGSLFREDNNE